MPDQLLSQSEATSPPTDSTLVLREHGPLDLREITRLTAIKMGCTLMYEDVDSVLRREAEDGRVVLVDFTTGDYRTWVWKAVV